MHLFSNMYNLFIMILLYVSGDVLTMTIMINVDKIQLSSLCLFVQIKIISSC